MGKIRYVRRAVELPVVYGPSGQAIVFDRISLQDMLWMLVTDLRAYPKTPAAL